MKYIPDVIADFSDCSSEEEYRTLAKNSDGTLAKITISDTKSGYKLYKPIELNPEGYKKFTQPKPELSKDARERLFNEYHRRIFSVPQTTTTGNNKRR